MLLKKLIQTGPKTKEKKALKLDIINQRNKEKSKVSATGNLYCLIKKIEIISIKQRETYLNLPKTQGKIKTEKRKRWSSSTYQVHLSKSDKHCHSHHNYEAGNIDSIFQGK